MPKNYHDCKLQDFIDYPRKYKKTDVMILQDIMIKESEFHEENESTLLKLIKLIQYKIDNHPLPQCKICFSNLEVLRKQGRKVNQFCSPKCRVEYHRRRNEVFPEQVRKFGGINPIMTWSEKKEHGYLLPSQRIDMKYTSRIGKKLKTYNNITKKRKPHVHIQKIPLSA